MPSIAEAKSRTEPGSVFVTGAASGMGRATALRLARDGYRVAAIDREPNGLRELEREFPERIRAYEVDLARLDQLEGFIQRLIVEFGPPDALVNAAGIALVATALETDLAAWQRVIDINLTAPMFLCRAVLPSMIERGGGVIVNIASVVGMRSAPSRTAYTCSKHGLVGLTRSLTADYGSKGIRANALCPGAVETGYTKDVMAVAKDPAAARKAMDDSAPVGRIGTAEEIASAVAYLIRPEASFFYGSIIAIDGGRTVY
ncbi:MAG: SDR family oxidoreductase [Betaproteobacteria bacterium]